MPVKAQTGVFQISVEGIPELEAKLQALGADAMNAGVKKALDAAGAILRDAILVEAKTSFKGQSETTPGGLLRGIRYETELTPGNEHVVAGPIWGKGTHARHLVIDGHDIVHRKGGPILGRARSNPFVERGMAAAGEAAVEAFEKSVIETLNTVVS